MKYNNKLYCIFPMEATLKYNVPSTICRYDDIYKKITISFFSQRPRNTLHFKKNVVYVWMHARCYFRWSGCTAKIILLNKVGKRQNCPSRAQEKHVFNRQNIALNIFPAERNEIIFEFLFAGKLQNILFNEKSTRKTFINDFIVIFFIKYANM